MTGVMVVDFDDTMVRTECRTKVTKQDGRLVWLTPAQYAVYVREDGDVMDYSEFETLRNPRPIKHTLRAMHRAMAAGMVVVVCTARANPQPVWRFLRQHGLYDVAVAALDSSDPVHKQQAVHSLMQGSTRVTFLDDSPKNVQAVGLLAGMYNEVKLKSKLA